MRSPWPKPRRVVRHDVTDHAQPQAVATQDMAFGILQVAPLEPHLLHRIRRPDEDDRVQPLSAPSAACPGPGVAGHLRDFAPEIGRVGGTEGDVQPGRLPAPPFAIDRLVEGMLRIGMRMQDLPVLRVDPAGRLLAECDACQAKAQAADRCDGAHGGCSFCANEPDLFGDLSRYLARRQVRLHRAVAAVSSIWRGS
jgi:hypothetical protein